MEQEKNVQKINYACIKKAAKKLFIKNGYGNTSMNDIAAELNIRKPSLYHHIKSREQLLIDMVNDIKADYYQAHNAIENIADSTIRKKKACELLTVTFNENSELGLLVKLLHEVKHVAVSSAVCSVINQWIQLLKHLFSDKRNQDKAAEHIHYLVGAMIFHKVCHKSQALSDYINQLAQLF